MKIKLSRGVAIGLLVLLLLMISLVVVAVRHFTRPAEPRETAVARAMEKAAEPGEHRVKELEAFKPAIAARPAPDAAHGHDDLWHVETHAKEHPAEKADHPLQQTFATAKPAVASGTEHEVHKDSELKRVEHEEPGLIAVDNRYAVPLVPPPSGARPGRIDAAAHSMVIQAAADANDSPPRRMDGHMPEKQAPAMENRLQLGAGRGTVEPPRNYPEPTRGELTLERTHPLRAVEPSPNELAGPASSYAARDPRPGYPSYDRPAEVPPPDNSPRGYPGPSAAYGRDEPFRHAEPSSTLQQNPLRNDGAYEVQPNDSYWTISQRVYGNGAYFRALAEANRGRVARPDRLAPGLLISTPPVAQLEKDYPDFCPRPNRREAIRNRAAGEVSTVSYSGGRNYVVQEGDSLTSIARNELGKVSRWAEIYQLNREQLGKDYDYLTPGMRLTLPPRESKPSDRMTQRGEEAPPFTR